MVLKLSDKIYAETILFPLNAISRDDVLHELLDHCIKLKYLTSSVKLFEYLKNDANAFNSASGRGIAYHYHTSIEINDTVLILGVSKDGIDYHAMDGLPCHFILLILEPMNEPNKHRTFINLFQDLIKKSNIKSSLLEVNSNIEIADIIFDWENSNEQDELI